MSQKILLLGASGLLGTLFLNKVKAEGQYQIAGVSRNGDTDYNFDISNESQLLGALEDYSPDVIINFAALTSVELCQNDPTLAYQINAFPCRHINAYLLKNPQKRCIHISTDHNYDGDGAKTETHLQVKNAYGASKLYGEVLLTTNSLVLRTNFFGRSISDKKSFSDWIVSQFKEETSQFNLFDDVYFSPLHWSTLATEILRAIQHPRSGIYNLGATTSLSKAAFAILIGKELGIYRQNYNVTTGHSKDRVPRPSNMTMNSKLWEQDFKVSLPSLEDEIKKLKEEY